MHTYIITEIIEDNGKTIEVIVDKQLVKEKALKEAKPHQRVYEVRRLRNNKWYREGTNPTPQTAIGYTLHNLTSE